MFSSPISASRASTVGRPSASTHGMREYRPIETFSTGTTTGSSGSSAIRTLRK